VTGFNIGMNNGNRAWHHARRSQFWKLQNGNEGYFGADPHRYVYIATDLIARSEPLFGRYHVSKIDR
jgi:hypothetical protein